MVSDKKIFCVFPILAYVEHVTLGAGHFWSQGYNLNKLGSCLLGVATYQISWLYALWFQTRKCFRVSPYIRLCKTCDSGAGPFLAPVL